MSKRNTTLLAALAGLGLAGAAAAQTPPAQIGERYIPAPWWMREPVIASIGRVRTELPANRARFGASFQEVDRTAAEATRKASDKVRALGRTLAAYGPDKVRVEITFNMRPLYDQYRDKEGNVQENQRSDKIDGYEVNAVLQVEVRDMALLERSYGNVLAARPNATQPVSFYLQPDNATNTWLHVESVKDAGKRARQDAEAAGARVAGIKVIDPTGRACQTDVLAGWPSYSGSSAGATTVDNPSMDAVAAMAPPPPPPPPPAPGGSEAEAPLPLQPPLRELTAEACVVFGLSGGAS